MPTCPPIFRECPVRLHGPRTALLAAIAQDRPKLVRSADIRPVRQQLARWRLNAVSRVQLRLRDGQEPFLGRADVALDAQGRIRATLNASAQTHNAIANICANVRTLHRIGQPPAQRRQTLHWRLHRIDLPTIDIEAIEARGFTRQHEPKRLIHIGHDDGGRPMLMAAPAARAFLAMRDAAHGDGVTLKPVSTFRSVAYQRGLLARKLKRGDSLASILNVNAAPGYSEHHSGRAIDIGTPGCPPLDACFEDTAAFAWLQAHAATYGFRLSYPRDNSFGVIYEPWHWCHHADLASTPPPPQRDSATNLP